MNRPKVASIAVDAFYDSFTCAALFRKLHIPGSPKEIVDPRPAHTFWADEFQQILAEVKIKFHAIASLLLVGVVVSFLLKDVFKRKRAQVEDSERFLADWSSYSKP